MTTDEITAMLTTSKKNLNLFHNERRWVLLAIIRANYKLPKAFKINDPQNMSYEGYIKKVYRYGVTMSELKATVKIIKKK